MSHDPFDQSAHQAESPSDNCLTAGCNKKSQWKGICRSCYGSALRLIERGETTWEELFDLGMCVLGEKPFLTEFRRRKKAAEVETNRTVEDVPVVTEDHQ